jgi:hypothetical protein
MLALLVAVCVTSITVLGKHSRRTFRTTSRTFTTTGT